MTSGIDHAIFHGFGKNSNEFPEWMQDKVTISIGRNSKDKNWRTQEFTFFEFLAGNLVHEVGTKDGLSFLQGCLAEDRIQRLKKAMVEMNFISLDIDNGFPIDKMIERIKENDLFALVYTSNSHGNTEENILLKTIKMKLKLDKDENDIDADDVRKYLLEEKKYHPGVLDKFEVSLESTRYGRVAVVSHSPMDKYRAVFPLYEPFLPGEVAGSQDEGFAIWAKKYAGVAQQLKIEFDASCTDVSRLFYRGRHKEDAPFESHLINGELLDLMSIKDGNPSGYIKMTGNEWLDQEAMSSGGDEEGDYFDYDFHDKRVEGFLKKHGKNFLAYEFWETYGVKHSEEKAGKGTFECTFIGGHSDPNDKTGFCVADAGEQYDTAFIHCMHTSCKGYKYSMHLDSFLHDEGIEFDELMEFVPGLDGSGSANSLSDLLDEETEIEDSGLYTEKIGNLNVSKDEFDNLSEDYQDFLSLISDMPEKKEAALIDAIKRLIGLELSSAMNDLHVSQISDNSGFGKRTVAKQVKDVIKQLAEEEFGTADKRYDKEVKQNLRIMNERHAMVTMNGRTIIMYDKAYRRDPAKNSITTMVPYDFNIRHRNKMLDVFDVAQGNTIQKNAADVWLDWADRREYSSLVFDPSGGNIMKDDVDGLGKTYNLWNGFAVEEKEDGNCDMLLDHIYENMCHSNDVWYDFFMSWFAHIIQVPEGIPGCAIVIHGDKGCGKSIVMEEIFANILLHPYGMKTADMKTVFGHFNARVENKLLVVMTEAFWGGDRTVEANLKDAITSNSFTLKLKGVDDMEIPNYRRFACTANAGFVVPATKDERRFFVLKCLSTLCGNPEHFGALMDQMLNEDGYGKLMHILTNWPEPKEGWKAYFFKPPVTPWLHEQISQNKPHWEKWLDDALYQGEALPSSQYADDLDEIVFSEDEETLVPHSVMHAWWKHNTRSNPHTSFIKECKKYMNQTFEDVVTSRRRVASYANPIWCYVFPPLSEMRVNHPSIFAETWLDDEQEVA